MDISEVQFTLTATRDISPEIRALKYTAEIDDLSLVRMTTVVGPHSRTAYYWQTNPLYEDDNATWQTLALCLANRPKRLV